MNKLSEIPTEADSVTIYTDGSCNTRSCTGGWAAIILAGNRKTVLQGMEKNTTHNRMELTAVIEAIDFAAANYPGASLCIYTDSQYVTNLSGRKEKLVAQNFITKKGSALPNADLLLQLISRIEHHAILFFKVKAHRKSDGTENLNREADMICRKIMRDASVE